MKGAHSSGRSSRLTERPATTAARLVSLREGMRRRGVRALLITNPVNLRYLAGASDAMWALVGPREAVVMPSSLSAFSVRSFARRPWRVANWRMAGREIAAVLNRSRLRQLGIESAHVSLEYRDALMRDLKGAAVAIPTTGLVEEVRGRKDDAEIALMRRAGSIAAEVARQLLYIVRAGKTERAVAREIERRMALLGAEGTAFPTIVLAGSRTVHPHGVPGDTRFKRGDLCLTDFGAVVDEYRSDITRTICVGRASPLARKRFALVRKAYQAGAEAARPGVKGRRAYKSARRALGRHAVRFIHGLGHGVGLEVHEGPRLAAGAEARLRERNVVTVEPGVYFPGWGGIRLENTLLVTKRGAESLTGEIPDEIPVTPS